MFLGAQREVFLDVFIIFRLRKYIPGPQPEGGNRAIAPQNF